MCIVSPPRGVLLSLHISLDWILIIVDNSLSVALFGVVRSLWYAVDIDVASGMVLAGGGILYLPSILNSFNWVL